MLSSDNLDYIEISEKEKFPIAFNLNVNAKIQSVFGSMSKWVKLVFPEDDENEKESTEADISAIIKVCQMMINEGIDIEGNKRDYITESEAGRILSVVGTQNLLDHIDKTQGQDSQDIEAEKNEDTP